MRIGVTGAFGFLGANFVSELVSRRDPDLEITAFASRTRSNPLFPTERVRTESLDVLDEEDLSRKFAGLDAVAHFAGKVDYRKSARRAVWEADVLGAKRVFDAALAAKVKRLLYVSSISVLGEPAEGCLADERSLPYGNPRYPIGFTNPEEALKAVDDSLRGDFAFLGGIKVAYLSSKLAAWELVKEYSRERGLPVVTIFPGTAVGAGDIHHAISSLVDTVWEGRLGLSFRGSTSFVAARDLAAGARLALERGRQGEAYVISGRDGHNMSYPDFMSLVSTVARSRGGRGTGSPLVIPRGVALAAAAAAERVAPGIGLAQALVRAGTVRNVCSSAKAMSELGYEPRADLSEAIAECRAFSLAIRAL